MPWGVRALSFSRSEAKGKATRVGAEAYGRGAERGCRPVRSICADVGGGHVANSAATSGYSGAAVNVASLSFFEGVNVASLSFFRVYNVASY